MDLLRRSPLTTNYEEWLSEQRGTYGLLRSLHLHPDVERHLRVQTGHSDVEQGIVQYGDIAEPHDPLGVAAQHRKVQVLQKVYGAVTPACAPDGPHLRVAQRGL